MTEAFPSSLTTPDWHRPSKNWRWQLPDFNHGKDLWRLTGFMNSINLMTPLPPTCNPHRAQHSRKSEQCQLTIFSSKAHVPLTFLCSVCIELAAQAEIEYQCKSCLWLNKMLGKYLYLEGFIYYVGKHCGNREIDQGRHPESEAHIQQRYCHETPVCSSWVHNLDHYVARRIARHLLNFYHDYVSSPHKVGAKIWRADFAITSLSSF